MLNTAIHQSIFTPLQSQQFEAGLSMMENCMYAHQEWCHLEEPIQVVMYNIWKLHICHWQHTGWLTIEPSEGNRAHYTSTGLCNASQRVAPSLHHIRISQACHKIVTLHVEPNTHRNWCSLKLAIRLDNAETRFATVALSQHTRQGLKYSAELRIEAMSSPSHLKQMLQLCQWTFQNQTYWILSICFSSTSPTHWCNINQHLRTPTLNSHSFGWQLHISKTLMYCWFWTYPTFSCGA
jgi:hypothetical protein